MAEEYVRILRQEVESQRREVSTAQQEYQFALRDEEGAYRAWEEAKRKTDDAYEHLRLQQQELGDLEWRLQQAERGVGIPPPRFRR